ncbi:LysR family transcriptional regulator [Paralcaligenes ureilyticus]|uniref:LysR family nitrogen assimilation transcriptional regulator n=1 Tax=Paralcaligenes ureilyticus TaxID=627131 RepID=A0A4R3LTF9_9BURK|nr:LysR family transcriptional regulator [Paralcaligenes ureilyticus]TCT03701.1 LysR family nitrogen assimilation transcriptional regulator [Paralcaligenes ureilyticus]
MDLRALRYFVAAADAGSLNAASAAISIAQPALTRQIRELERDLGVTLLYRTSRGVHLTTSGATLYTAAQRILAEAGRVRKQLEDPGSVAESTVVLGASPTLARILIPGVFETCQRTLTRMPLSVREAFTPALLDWLVKGIVDIAIITKTDDCAGMPITLQPFLGEPFALVAQKSRKIKPVIEATDLRQIPLLMTTLHRGLIEQQLAPLGIPLNIHAEVNSVDTIRELVLGGAWSTLMPISVFKPIMPGSKITLSEISGVQLNRQLLIATRIERAQNPAVSVLKDLIITEAGRLSRDGVFSFGAPSR